MMRRLINGLSIRNKFRLRFMLMTYLSVFLLGCTEKEQHLNLLFAGDMMLDRGTRKVIERKNIDYLFQEVKPVFLKQDAVLVNFEGTACDTRLSASSKAFCFRADTAWLPRLKHNGITAVSLANNHSGDFGSEGLRQTAASLHNNKITTLGYQEQADPCAPFLLEKNDIHVAIFSSALLFEKEAAGSCHESDALLCKRISQFKQQHPAYHVILCLHWGIEMQLTPEKKQTEQAHAFIDAGADLIIGHHPHVVQPIEQYKNKYIFYSLGNFIFDNEQSPSNKGIFGCFSVTAKHIELKEVIPFTITHSKPMLMNTKEAAQFLKPFSPSF